MNIKTSSLIASSIFAPYAFKNEDRGYFRTALLTTPAIFAAGTFVPNMLPEAPAMARAAVGLRDAIRFKAKTATNIVDKQVSESLIQSTRRQRDLGREAKTLDKYFKRRFVSTPELVALAESGNSRAIKQLGEINALQSSNNVLLSNALQSARFSALSPSEWNTLAIDSGFEGDTSSLTNDQLLTMYEKYVDPSRDENQRGRFIRTLRQRLREIHPHRKNNRLTYKGPVSTTALKINSAMNVETARMDFDEEFGLSKYEKSFKDQFPTAYENLRSAKKRGLITDPEITAELSEKVTTGEVGRLLNVKVARRGNIKDVLSIPIVDTNTGQVRLGKQFEHIGVGNYILGPNESGNIQHYSLPDWISKMLAEHSDIPTNDLEKDITAHAYWMAGDPLDSRRMSELSSLEGGGENIYNPLQTKLRSLSAGITSQSVFVNSEGNRVAFNQLTASEQTPILKQMANNNRYIPMGSEAGVYELRYQLREAAYLDPFGITGADKQDWLWRTLTKEFNLSAPEGLPSGAELGWKNKSWENLPGEMPLAKGTLHLLDPQDRAMLAEHPELISDVKSDQDLLRQLGRMGESVTLMDEKFASAFQLEGVSKYNVNEGLSVNVGDFVDPTDVMGFMDKVRVAPKFSGQVINVGEGSEGSVVNVRHALSMHGAKTDFGVKGMNLVTDVSRLKELLNSYYENNGSGNFIPEDVNILGTSEYLGDKIDPVQTYLGLGRDLTERLQKAGAGDVAGEYLSGMSELGAEFQNNQFVISSEMDLGSLGNKNMSERLQALSSITENFFAKAGDAIRNAGGYQDPVLTAFVHQGKDYGTWMMKNRLELSFGAWDHSLVNTPRQVMLGHDFETFMTLGNNVKGLAAVRSRLQTTSGGSVQQSIDFMKYLMAGKFDQQMGSTISLKDAFPGKKLPLSRASGRAGTIFDPDNPAYRNNFRLDLGGGDYLPVPGTAAYGAESPLFGPGQYQTRDWQNTLQNLAFASTDTEKADLKSKLLQQYKSEFGIGKGGALRPYQYDPYAVPGVLGVTSEQGDPFVARVGDEFVNRMRSASQRSALKNGDIVLGLLQRQPTNELMYLKYQYDPSFSGTMDVGVPERLSRAFYGDVDKDLVNNILIDAHVQIEKGKMRIASFANAAEKAAAEEAIEAIEGGRQYKRLAAWEEMMGTGDIANMVTSYTPKNLADRAVGMAQGITNRPGKIMNRTAGASIGQNSNILTEMLEQMVQASPELGEDVTTRLRIGLFESLKQTPISARKVGGFSMETMVQIADQVRHGIAMNNPEESAEHIRNMMQWVSSKTKSPVNSYWTSEASREHLELWAARRTEKARLAAAALKIGTNIESRNAAARTILPKIFEQGLENVMGAAHGGSVSSASRLGSVANVIADIGREGPSVTGQIGKIFSQHGKSLALGLGAIAALGIALTPNTSPVATFSRKSGNSMRPEERMGVADSIPGEPVLGIMSPSSPPRRIEPGRPNVNTSVVAPMNRTSDLSVRMQATNQSRAAETARLLSQIPGGNYSNVTVNYRDRTKLHSLRTREKIREIMQ